MTISSTTRVAGPFTGNDSAATFPFPFKVFLAADLYVLRLDVAAGSITVLALETDYTAVVNEDQDADPGGSITLTAGNLPAGYTLTLTTDIAELQGLDLTNGGGFYPDTMNAALDLLTILIQQLKTQLSRALQVPLVDSGIDVTLPPADERAGTVLGFDGNGNVTLVTVLEILGDGGHGAYATVELAPAAPGNFTKAHGLAFTPSAIVVQMSSGGQIWKQKPLGFDETNLYLVASDGGVTGTALCFS